MTWIGPGWIPLVPDEPYAEWEYLAIMINVDGSEMPGSEPGKREVEVYSSEERAIEAATETATHIGTGWVVLRRRIGPWEEAARSWED